MAINKEDLIKLVDQLPESAQQSAYDYLQFLSSRSRLDWDEINQMEPDDIPLSKEEERQLNNSSGFLSWEEAMHELNLPTDIKP